MTFYITRVCEREKGVPMAICNEAASVAHEVPSFPSLSSPDPVIPEPVLQHIPQRTGRKASGGLEISAWPGATQQ